MQPQPSVAPSLEPDCENCAALCCVALHVEKSSKFAIDKPAGVACPNLAPRGRCRIHASLSERGFSGCVAYDCLGAGQRVVQELYDGISWQPDQSLLAPMSEDFAKMRRLHTLIELLVLSENIELRPALRKTRTTLLQELAPTEGWSRLSFASVSVQSLEARTHAFLKDLAPLLSAKNTNKLGF